MRPTLLRRAVAEFLGTGFLVATVVGSGIMGERLAAGNAAIALLANTIATGAVLVALILTFGPISGAHFNRAVTIADATERGLPWSDASSIPSRSIPRWHLRHNPRAYHVSFPAHFALASCAKWLCSDLQRVHRYVWVAVSDLGLFEETL
jgi:hypothetical protein